MQVSNLSNFWSGEWITRFTVKLHGGSAATSTSATITGSIRIVTHYFESGNTQLHEDKALPPTDVSFAAGDAAAFAASVVSALAKAEDTLQAGLEGTLESMSTTALKEMRRFLPVSGTKFNWNVAEHRIRHTLMASAGKTS